MATRARPKSIAEQIALWLMLITFGLFAGWLIVAAARDLWVLIIVLTS